MTDPYQPGVAEVVAVQLDLARTFTGFPDPEMAGAAGERVYVRVNGARLRVGASDRGTLWVTDRRVVFRGGHRGFSCRLDQVRTLQEDPAGTLTLTVAHRRRPVTLVLGEDAAARARFRLDLALAQARGTLPDLIGQLQARLRALAAQGSDPPPRAGPTGGRPR